MIKCTNLAKKFGKIQAVSDVSFKADDGAITAVLGLNGSGKSTTLRMLTGILKPSSGSALIDNLNANKDPREAQKRMGFFPDRFGLYDRLTVKDHIKYYARLHGMREPDLGASIKKIAKMIHLESLLDRPTKGFSTGQSMKTALARILVHNPQNVILDEPTRGLDVEGVKQLRQILLDAREQGKCIVLSSHVMPEVERIADHFVIIANGRTIAEGSLDHILTMTSTNELEDAFATLNKLNINSNHEKQS